MSKENMANYSGYDLAVTLNDFMAAAFLRWDDFTDSERTYFRRLQDEACKRFVHQQLDIEEAADEHKR